SPRRHHGRGSDLADLDDGGLALRTKREDRSGDGVGVTSLVGRNYPILRLRGVEFHGKLLDLTPEFTRHGVPPHDVGDGSGRRGNWQDKGRQYGRKPQKTRNRLHDMITLEIET